MKIKLTRQQCMDIANDFSSYPDCAYVDITPDQITNEKTNREKWEEITVLFDDKQKFLDPSQIAAFLDSLGYKADAAYNEIVGSKDDYQ